MSEEDNLELRTLTGQSVYGSYWNYLSNSSNASGVPISPETSLQASAVLACVRVKAESLASLPWYVYERTENGGKEIADLPINEVLSKRPNSWMSSFEFRELMHSWVLLWGNAYALIKAGKLGAVTELIPLHPSRMTIERLSNGKLRYTYVDPNNGTPIYYRQDQILHIRWLSRDGVLGYVPSSLSQEAIALARATEIQSGAFFGNGAKPGLALEASTPLKPETMHRLKDQLNDVHQGARSAYRTMVIPHGLSIKQLNDGNMQTAQLIESRRYQCEEIARVYRVPVSMIGQIDGASYNSQEQQAREFVTFSLMPDLQRWKGAVDRDLLTDDMRYFSDFDVTALLLGDLQARATYVRELFHIGVLSINEIRDLEGYNPIEEGDKRFVQTSMALVSAFTDENPTAQANVSHANPDEGEAGVEAYEDQPEEEEPVADE